MLDLKLHFVRYEPTKKNIKPKKNIRKKNRSANCAHFNKLMTRLFLIPMKNMY